MIDLTSSNILFRISDEVPQWPDDMLYLHLGSPETEDVYTHDGSPLSPHAPPHVVAPIDASLLCASSLLQEEVLLKDFGQSFFTDQQSQTCVPATHIHYFPPEAFFDSQFSFSSDIWALACLLFGIRVGSALFDPFLGSGDSVLMQVVETLGKLPDPWWNLWKARDQWFDDMREPIPEGKQSKRGVLLASPKTSPCQKLCEIGQRDDPPLGYEGDMFEKTGTRLGHAETLLFADLLERMLRYRPEERIIAAEVVQHPWFRSF